MKYLIALSAIVGVLTSNAVSYSQEAPLNNMNQYDYFDNNTNALTIRFRKNLPANEVFLVHMDMVRDAQKRDLDLVRSEIKKALQLFADSFNNPLQQRTIEIAVTPGAGHALYRYKEGKEDGSNFIIIDNAPASLKMSMDTIRVIQHFDQVKYGDTSVYKIVYEAIVKDVSHFNPDILNDVWIEDTDKFIEKEKGNFFNTLSRFNYHVGVGIMTTTNEPLAFLMECTLMYRTGHQSKGNIPFVGLNIMSSIRHKDGFAHALNTISFEFGGYTKGTETRMIQRSSLMYGLGIINKNKLDGTEYAKPVYLMTLGFNLPISGRLHAGFLAGSNFSLKNNQSYLGVNCRWTF